MGRMYAVTFTAVAVTATQDLFMIAPAANKPVAIHELILGQSSDVGDAAEEILRVQIIRGHTTVGSGGSSVTPAPMLAADTAAGFTARVNDTTIASAGTTTVHYAEPFNIRAGLDKIWTPETRPYCTNGETRIVVRLMASPADELTMSGTLYVEEVF